MRHAVYLLSAWLWAVMLILPQLCDAADLPDTSGPSLCLDGMLTVPFEDDLTPIAFSADTICTVPQAPVLV